MEILPTIYEETESFNEIENIETIEMENIKEHVNESNGKQKNESNGEQEKENNKVTTNNRVTINNIMSTLKNFFRLD